MIQYNMPLLREIVKQHFFNDERGQPPPFLKLFDDFLSQSN